MARQFCLPEILPPVEILPPAADASGRSGAWLFVGYWDKLWIVCRVNQGNAATVQFTPQQATNLSGAGAKALTNSCPIWTDLDEAGGDQFTKQTAAANYTTDAGLHSKIVIFEISPQDHMDVTDGFCAITCNTGASNAANITQIDVYGLHRYQQTVVPSVLTLPGSTGAL
jgi:hypothetical protein